MEEGSQRAAGSGTYRMPAEWSSHQATWISWPHNADTWPGHLPGVERTMAEAVGALASSELVRINGDLGRLGGLLKLWLTDDVRTLQFGEATILALLGRIEATQDEMSRIMKAVVQPRAEP